MELNYKSNRIFQITINIRIKYVDCLTADVSGREIELLKSNYGK